MLVIRVIAALWVAILSSCASHDSHALTISESQQEYDDRVDFESIRDEVMKYIGMPSGLHLDDLKMDGTHIASIQAHIHFYF